MQVTMSMEEYETLIDYRRKYLKIRACVLVNYKDFKKNIVDESNPITIDKEEVYKILQS